MIKKDMDMTANKKGIQITLTSCEEVKFMLNIPTNRIEVNELKFGLLNRITPNLDNKLLIVDLGIQYSYLSSPIMECRYAFSFSYENTDGEAPVIKSDTGIQINNELLSTIINIATGAIRGIMIAKTTGTQLAKYPLPLLNMDLLMKNMVLVKNDQTSN